MFQHPLLAHVTGHFWELEESLAGRRWEVMSLESLGNGIRRGRNESEVHMGGWNLNLQQ